MTTNNWIQRAQELDLRIRNFINGQYVDTAPSGRGDELITKHSPRDGQLLYKFGSGIAEEVDQAVNNAREAFEDGRWSDLSVLQRKAVLQKLADLLEANKEELALYDCLDVGKPISAALHGDVGLAASFLRDYAEGADKLLSTSGADGGTTAYQMRKPVGVVGAIVGWNFPLWMAAMKVGPALAMGNSLVLKPSEFSSLSAGRFAELALEAGVPPGVFNVVHGAGATVGAALAQHPSVNLISFTGSSATGKKMMIAAGQSNMKRLLLECGGKSPFIVFDDCPEDLDVIAAAVVEMAFSNQGEVCVAGTRLLIQNGIKNKLLPKIIEQAAQLKPQDPLDPNTTFGALINEAQMHKVLAYIESGKQQGAELILGGERIEVDTGSAGDNNSSQGYYVEPTIFDNVDPQHNIAQEEIFGPVLSVISFDDEDEAIQIANNTCYGLAAYATTQNLGRAQRLARRINSGHLMILGSSDPADGSVGVSGEPQKESGFGCEVGLAGLASYTVSTAVQILV